MVAAIMRCGKWVIVGGLGISLATAHGASFQPQGNETGPAADAAPVPEVPDAGEPAPPPERPTGPTSNDPAAIPNAGEPVPPPEPDRPTGPTPSDPAAESDPEMREAPAEPVPPPDPAPGSEPAPGEPAPVDPLAPTDAAMPAETPAPPAADAPPRPAPPDAFPPATYEEPRRSDFEGPSISLGAVVREPVSIHEARERVLTGNVQGACIALAVLSTRYPTDARVDYLEYIVQWRMGQPAVALAALERAVALEYYYPIGDYSLFMEPIQGSARIYAERVRRSVRELDARDVLVIPPREELLPPPPEPPAAE